MKKSIIREMFLGNGRRMETREISEFLEKEEKAYDALTVALSPEARKLRERYDDALLNSRGETEISHFVEGFKLGVLVGIECMED